MYDENAEFSLTWSPPRYPVYSADDTGSWRVVLEEDTPIGVIWLNDDGSGAGVQWVDQTDSIEKLRSHFNGAYEAELKATAAFNSANYLPGVKFTELQTGPLSDIEDELDGMTAE